MRHRGELAKHRAQARSLLALFGAAVGINFIWEMAQMSLYQNMPFGAWYSWWLCFRASIGDGVIVLTIWALGATLRRRFMWFAPIGPTAASILLLSGAIIAVGIEIHAISTGRWTYSELMPLLPIVDVGVSPFVQLLVLPFISMKIAIGRW